MKKTLSIFLCLLLCLPLVAGCTDTGETDQTEAGADTGSSQTVSGADAPLLTGIKIGGNDIAGYVIVKPADASESEAFAAEELAAYIEKSCGSKLEIVTETASEKTISLIRDTSGELGEEGFHIKTAAGKVTITGGTVRGCLYGVYEFLESCIGWRFLTNDVEYLKAEGTVEIADGIDDRQVPGMEWRHNRTGSDAKLRTNWSYRQQWGGAHTLYSLSEISKWGNPCLSDEATYTTVLSNIFEILQKDPSLRRVSVSQEDTGEFCHCEKCKKVYEEEGYDRVWEDGAIERVEGVSGLLLRFANRIAQAVEAAGYTEVDIVVLSFYATYMPPSITRAVDNIEIWYAPINRCFLHAVDDPDCNEWGGVYDQFFNNVYFAECVTKWTKICDYVTLYEYDSCFYEYMMVFPHIESLCENIRFYAENNVKGWYSCADASSAEFNTLRSYLISKLLWNPYMTEDEYQTHIDDFLMGYYGSGWEEIGNYLDFAENSLVKRGECIPCLHYHDPSRLVVQKDYVLNKAELETLFERAETAVTEAGETAAAQHIADLKLSYLFTMLSCTYWTDYVMGSEAVREEWMTASSELYNEIELRGFPLSLSTSRFVEGIAPTEWVYVDAENPKPATWIFE